MKRKQRATTTQEFETGIKFFVFDVLWTIVFDFVMVVCDRKGYLRLGLVRVRGYKSVDVVNGY
jgi:hypothetical protein